MTVRELIVNKIEEVSDSWADRIHGNPNRTPEDEDDLLRVSGMNIAINIIQGIDLLELDWDIEEGEDTCPPEEELQHAGDIYMDTMTLTELAHELRKIFKFRYLTGEIAIYNSYFCMWDQKPRWDGKYWRSEEDGKKHIVTDFLTCDIAGEIDLSEYKDEQGNIDYSRCIVEVTDASE